MRALAMSRCIPPSCDWSSCRTDLPICLSTCLSLRLPRSWKLLDELVWAVARMAWNEWQCPYLNSVKLPGIWIRCWILLHRDMRSDDSFRPFLRSDPCCKSPCSLVSMAIGIMIPDAPCAKRLSELPLNLVVFTLNFHKSPPVNPAIRSGEDTEYVFGQSMSATGPGSSQPKFHLWSRIPWFAAGQASNVTKKEKKKNNLCEMISNTANRQVHGAKPYLRVLHDEESTNDKHHESGYSADMFV